MTLPLADFAGVVGPGGRVAKRGEGGQEHGPLELLVAASRGMLASNGRAGPARDGRKARVRGEVSSRGEGSTGDVGQESGCSPDSDSWQASQDWVDRKSVVEGTTVGRA